MDETKEALEKTVKRNRFSFFLSFLYALEDLEEKDQLKLLKYILYYGFFDIEPSEKGVARSVFRAIKPVLDKSLSISDKRAKSGKYGGEKSSIKQTEANAKQTEAKRRKPTQTASKQEANGSGEGVGVGEGEGEGVGEGEGDNNINNKKNNIVVMGSKNRFTKPTLEEVQAYCIERGNGVAAQHFIDYYEAKGWIVGKSPMKDWKAAVRTWERNSTTDYRPQNEAPKHDGRFDNLPGVFVV